jgi:hypothetical protein
MGFFSSIGGAIGTLFGPVGTVIGAGLGGALDGKKTQKTLEKQVAENNRIATIAAENTNKQMENNSRPVETVTTNEADFDSVIRDAEKAGINPLTALRTAGANSRVTSTTTQVGTTRYVAPLLSSMPSRNFLDVMGDAYKGYQSFQRGQINRQKEGLEMQYLKNQVANSMPNLARTGISSGDVLGTSDLFTNSKLNNGTHQLGVYDLVQDPVTREGVTAEGFGTVDSKIKSMWGTFETRQGKRIPLPFTEFEADQMITQGAFNLYLEAMNLRDKGLTAVKNWWNSAPADKTPMSEIRSTVNDRKILQSFIHQPKLSSNWTGYKVIGNAFD